MEKILHIFSSFKKSLDIEHISENSIGSFVLICALTFMLLYLWYTNKKRKYGLPPGPYGLPVLGYLPFLKKEAFRDFDKLSKKYGNIFSLYLGQTFVVVLGDFEAAKDAFSKSTTLDRPKRLFDFFPDGVGFSSVNGEEWAEQRRYSVKAMRNLGLGRSKWENLVQEEVDDFIKLIHKFGGNPVDITNMLTGSVFNNISSLVFGKRLPLNEENIKFVCDVLEKVFMFSAQTGWRHYFPSIYDILSKFGILQHTKFCKEFEDFNNFVRNEVDLRKQVTNQESTEIYIDGYLKEIKNNEEQNLGNTFNENNLRGNVNALILGGSDTTKLSIGWLLLAMAKYSDIQEKVHQELDSVLGKDGNIQWSDRSSLPYTVSVILEGQRWRTIAPLNTSRIAMEDIKIGKYDIPKGTTIIANNWGIHNDTRYWKQPDKFIPERFLSDDGKQVNYKPDSYVPFSYGKRGCPGETVAMGEIFCYFVSLLQNFDVLPPENGTLEMDGILGLTYQTKPQELKFVARR